MRPPRPLPPAAARPAPLAPPPLRIAIRTDRMRLDAALPYQLPGRISAVEYHGLHVRLGLEDADGNAHSLLLTEAEFFARPLALGDAVAAGFTADDVHLLAT